MEMLIDFSVPSLFILILGIFGYDFYVKYIKTIENTDKIDLIARYVELRRVRGKN